MYKYRTSPTSTKSRNRSLVFFANACMQWEKGFTFVSRNLGSKLRVLRGPADAVYGGAIDAPSGNG